MDDLRNGAVRFNFGKGLPQKRGKDFCDVPRRKTMNWARRGSSGTAVAVVAAIALGIFAGCKTQEKNPDPVPAVTLETQADGIHLKTAQAEFVLTTTGSLLGRFRNGTQWLTLDEAAPGSGIVLTSGKQVVNDLVRALGHAQI